MVSFALKTTSGIAKSRCHQGSSGHMQPSFNCHQCYNKDGDGDKIRYTGISNGVYRY